MIKRTFLLGEEWLYYKIYCGVRTADRVLVELIMPLIEKLLDDHYISAWFFIRYGDPDPHLRLRFRVSNIHNLGIIIEEFNKVALPYLDHGSIWKIQTDTYNRELERYGSTTMVLSEELFFYESSFILKALHLVKDEGLYFMLVVKAVDDFVSLFEFGAEEKLKFYQKWATAYKNEFKIDKTTKLSLDKKYRNSSKHFALVMSNKLTTLLKEEIVKALNERNDQIRPLTEKLLKYNTSNTLEVTLNDLLSSYIHMFVNRVFRDRQRFYEMVVYDFLVRYQSSKLKREENLAK